MSSVRRRIFLVAVVVVLLLITVWLGLAQNCPSVGIALTSRARHLHRLKNRTAFPQAADCFNPNRRDIHILIATHKGAAKNEQVVLEVTPNWRDWASAHALDWSEQTLHSQ